MEGVGDFAAASPLINIDKAISVTVSHVKISNNSAEDEKLAAGGGIYASGIDWLFLDMEVELGLDLDELKAKNMAPMQVLKRSKAQFSNVECVGNVSNYTSCAHVSWFD